jgi:hypothetical protein
MARKCGLWGRPSQNLLLGTPLHPLLAHTGDCWLLLAGWKHPILGCAAWKLMCCQSLGHCYRICGKSKLYLGPRGSSICGVSACCSIGRGLGSCVQTHAEAPSLTALFYLFTNWWAGARLVGLEMFHWETYVTSHLGLYSACVSIRC